MKLAKTNLKTDRLSYLAAAALFLFFLLYSAPHQIHHSFEHSDSPSPCQAFAVAKGCHLQTISPIDFSFTPTASAAIVFSPSVWIPYFTPSPFSQRAPPTA
jgi:hypothetical protein